MDFFAKHWGDLASVLGLALTIWFAFQAKTAAQQARDAALQVKERMSTLDTIGDLSSAITILQEIMRLQRTQAWEVVWDIVLDRYTILQSHLVRSELAIGLTAGQRAALRVAIGHFRIIMGDVESARTTDQQGGLDTPRFNSIISEQIAVLERLSVEVRKAGA